MRLISTLACFLCLSVCGPARADETRSLDIDGIKRSYALHVPVGIGPSAPLVVVLHGKASSGAEEMVAGQWQSRADKEKFIVVAPDALDSYDGVDDKRPWTLRDWLRRTYRILRGRNVVRWDGGQNDVDLIASVIDRVGVGEKIDQSRIYMVGYSRGGFMAHRMALQITARLAGVAIVSPDVEPEAKKAPKRPLSFLLVVGDRDPVLPVSADRPAAIMERWRAVDHCPPLAKLESGSAPLLVEGAGPCSEGTEIRYVIAQDVGHDWTRAPIHYSDISWAFLSQFRRQPLE
jgi:polyhydroxybutyrate depolymerase